MEPEKIKKIYEILNNIPVTSENISVIEEIKEELLNQNYITALQKMEQLSKIKEQEPKVKIEETEEEQEGIYRKILLFT